jgi:hypothetical protein
LWTAWPSAKDVPCFWLLVGLDDEDALDSLQPSLSRILNPSKSKIGQMKNRELLNEVIRESKYIHREDSMEIRFVSQAFFP